MAANLGVAMSMEDRLGELGDIPSSRVRLAPAPGTASVDDLLRVNEARQGLYELVDHTLVEKAMSYEASVVAGAILAILRSYCVPRKLGIVSGADGMFQLLMSAVRGPDVAFLSRERLPNGKFPREAYPSIAPNLAIEVLSPGNTKSEMARKRIEYFHSGVELVWIVDCVNRSVAVYTSPDACTILGENEIISGGKVLPEFQAKVADFFVDLDYSINSQ